MNDLQVFKSSDFGELGILTIENKEYFPATACAKILGYAVPKDAITAHCKGAVKHRLLTNGGYQEMKFIPEGDLYRLIVKSKLPSAEKFEKWVFDEVLPSLRKNGGYMTNSNELIAQTATAVVSEVVKQLLPILQGSMTNQSSCIEESEPLTRTRKRCPSIISKLDVEFRQEVEEMLCAGKYTYSDIVHFLEEHGIKISMMSVSRYAKSLF